MSAIGDLFTNIGDKLNTLGFVGWWDWDLGQYEKTKQFPVEYPAVIIQFPNILWEKPNGDNNQDGVVNVRLKFAYQFANTEFFTQFTTVANEEVIYFYQLIAEIRAKMNEVGGSLFSVMQLGNDYLEKIDTENFIAIYVLEYFCNVKKLDNDLDDAANIYIDWGYHNEVNFALERKKLNRF